MRIDGYAVFLVAVGTQFPDLVDKPLGWTLKLLPSGRSMGHSLIFAVPVVAFVAMYYQRRGRLPIAVGFAVGYASHLLTDGIYYVPSGEYRYYSYLLWPFVPQPPYPTNASIIAHVLRIEPDPYFLLQLVLVACTAGLWIWDETPGISAGSANIRGETARTSDKPSDANEEKAGIRAEDSQGPWTFHPSLTECDSLVPRDSDEPPTLSVVIPTLNEQESIGPVIEQVKAIGARAEITAEIIVADNSTDETPVMASDGGAFVVVPDRIGYGYACRFAIEYVRGDLVAFGTGDSAYDFRELPELLAPLIEGDADVTIGSRLEGDVRSGAASPLGDVGNALLSAWLNIFYGVDVRDVGSGFRALHRETLEAFDLEANGVEFVDEMLVEAAGRDRSVVEVPITYHKRDGRRRLDSFQTIWRHLHFVALNTSGYLFLLPGSVSIVAGAVMLPLSVANASVLGVSFDIHLLIASSTALIAGYQLVALGVFARVTGNPVRMPVDPGTKWLVESLRLRHVATTGVFLLGMGSTYVLYALNYWLSNEASELTVLVGDIIAFTAITLGIQMILSSFYISFVHR